MAGSFSDYTENKVLDEIFGATDFVAPATVYVALFTARGTIAQADANTTFTEVTGGSYVRKSVTNNATNFPAASAGSKSNGTAVTFVTATADWGTVTCFGIYDASSAGNLIAWADLTQNKTISNGDTASFAISALTITLD